MTDTKRETCNDNTKNVCVDRSCKDSDTEKWDVHLIHQLNGIKYDARARMVCTRN